MKQGENSVEEIMNRALTRHSGPPLKQVESASERVWQRVQSNRSMRSTEGAKNDRPVQRRRRMWWPAIAAVAGFLLLSVLFLPRPAGTAESPLFRAAESGNEAVHATEPIWTGEILRSGDRDDATFTLADGSRVEMRAKSELVLELSADGVRIRLNKGSVIVTAAKQRNRHLYVRTPDLTVSVVGTVFVVNAAESGSSVAVFQGEVHVQQGQSSQTLLPGEEVTTNLSMEPQPVSTEIAWSRHAEEHLALLQQSTATTSTIESKFDVTSVRRNTTGGERSAVRIGPNRFTATNVTLQDLIVRAYGVKTYQLSGGPDWIRSIQDRYDVEATTQDPVSQDRLLVMLQELLADRFKLQVRNEIRQISAYALLIGKAPLKVIESSGGDNSASSIGNSVLFSMSGPRMRLSGKSAPISQLALWLTSVVSRTRTPVFDKTGLEGKYDFQLEWLPEDAQSDVPAPTLFTATQEQLGLELKSTKESVETVLIVNAEKPSEN